MNTVWIVLGDMCGGNGTDRNIFGVFANLEAAKAFEQKLFEWRCNRMSKDIEDEPNAFFDSLPVEVSRKRMWEDHWTGYCEIAQAEVHE